MEIGKEKQLIQNFIEEKTTRAVDTFFVVQICCEEFVDWLRKEGFGITSYVVDHDDFIEQSRKHFALENCNMDGRKLETVPSKVQGGKDSKSPKSKQRGDKKNV